MNKQIGIYADSYDNRVGQSLAYMQFASLFGDVHLITSQNYNSFIKNIQLDLLIVPGGADIYSQNYNEAPNFHSSRSNPHYEYLDYTFLKPLLEDELRYFPIVGICRGMQTINVLLGGSLYQHVINHNNGESRNHRYQIAFTYENQYVDRYSINSLHHQAINILGKDLKVIAVSLRDDLCPSKYISDQKFLVLNKKDTVIEASVIIEAFINKEKKILGVQWHPEEYNCPWTIQQINNLL